jgi:hypothetical protein
VAYPHAGVGQKDDGSGLVGDRYRVSRYRGFRLVKAQAGWDIMRGMDKVGWAPTKELAKRFVDDQRDGTPRAD